MDDLFVILQNEFSSKHTTVFQFYISASVLNFAPFYPFRFFLFRRIKIKITLTAMTARTIRTINDRLVF